MPYPKTTQIRTERRAAAELRQAKYAALPFDQKLAAAGAKEKAKLAAKQVKQIASKVPPKKVQP